MGRVFLAGDPPVPITLRKSHRAQRVSLRVSSLDGRVTLSIPDGMDEAVALAFAEQKSDWIKRHLAKQDTPVIVGFGQPVLYRGEEVPVAQGRGQRALWDGAAIRVPGGPAMAGARVKAFLKLDAKARLQEAVARYSAMLGRRVGKITLRDTRSRWGSCTASGNLMFSWRLAMAPDAALDYVAAHEVAHLVELNHSPAYWRVVQDICPGFDAPRRWLKTQGFRLHRYRFGD